MKAEIVRAPGEKEAYNIKLADGQLWLDDKKQPRVWARHGDAQAEFAQGLVPDVKPKNTEVAADATPRT